MKPASRSAWSNRLRVALLRMSRGRKRQLMCVVDIATACSSLALALAIVMPTPVPGNAVPILLAAASAACLLSVHATGLYRSIVRYIGVDMFLSVVRATALAVAFFFPVMLAYLSLADAVRLAAVHAALLFIGILATRFLGRVFLNTRTHNRERVVVYGAGSGGLRLVAALAASPRFLPVAFVDDDPNLIGRRIAGLEVHDSASLQTLIRVSNVRRVLLAMPSVSRKRRKQVIERLSNLKVRVQTIPDVGELMSGSARVDDIQDVSVEDLLGRDPVPPQQQLLEQENTGRVVLVTGAGGSIGSELCRKLLELQPRLLLLVEHSEIALYTIERELSKVLADKGIDLPIVPMLGSVTDGRRMLEIMRTFHVETVYHAAAYKHVPIVEHNVLEGVANNVFGTLHTAQAAIEAGVRTFVLISTDKAVSPTNVMGASKRLAELVLQSLDQRSRTRFCMVRFGNVLASSGSVVPLFREQIRNGGPVTVTHPEIIRYFMTIPEAAQLVIQAGAMATGGDVFVLDMGKPVKILDLATKMIQLMGKTVRNEDNPNGEIEISFTGLRPAEKLYEELLIGSDVTGTTHPRILRANEQYLEHHQLQQVLGDIGEATDARDWERLREILLRSVEGYAPTGAIEDHVFLRLAREPDPSKVATLDAYRRQDNS